MEKKSIQNALPIKQADAKETEIEVRNVSPEPWPEEIPWTEEALRRVENAPAFVRPGIRKLMPLRARALGQPVITSGFLTQIRNESMLRVTRSIKHFGFEELTANAFVVARQKMQRHPRKLEVLGQIEDFLAQRTGKNAEIMAKFESYFELVPTSGLPWTPEALAGLEPIPEFVRGMVRQAVEAQAKKHKEKVVTPQLFSRVAGELIPPYLNALAQADRSVSTHTTAGDASSLPVDDVSDARTLVWDPEPLQRLQRIPIAAIRQRVMKRVENYCQEQGANRVTAAHFLQARWRTTDRNSP